LVTYLFAVLYCCTVIGNYGYNYFGLFLKSLENPDGTKRWSVTQVNAIPISGSVMQVIFVWVWALISDYFQVRWQLIIVQASIATIPAIMMTIWTRQFDQLSISVAYVGYFMMYMVLGTAPLIFSWLADL
jgi:hypothetical protein